MTGFQAGPLFKARNSNCVRRNLMYKRATFGMVLALFAFALQLYVSSAGQFMPAVHGDWASHAATTRAIFLNEDFSSSVIKSTLNEFSTYPRLTYYSAATIAKTFDISPLRGLTIVTVGGLILACLFFAFRLQSLVLERKPTLYFLLFALLYVFTGVYILELGFRDLAISNSFISQLVSLAIAQISLFLAKNVSSFFKFLALALISSFLLVNTHIIGFVWCMATMTVMSLGFPNVSFRRRIFLSGLVAFIAAIFLFSSPGVLEMTKISGSGGDLRAWNGKNLSDYPIIFAALMSIYIFFSGLTFFYCRKKVVYYSDAFWNGAGFLVLGPLILASAATVILKGGNWYPVVKWIYLFFPELLVFLIFLFSGRKLPSERRRINVLSYGFLMIFFVAQLPYFSAKIDLTPAIQAEDGTFENADTHTRRYPALLVDHPALNYFIARSVLKIPTNTETVRWMNNEFKPVNPLTTSDFLSVAPRISPNQVVRFSQENRMVLRMLTSEWWGLESGHVWASHSPASIFFLAKETPKSIKISFVPFISALPASRVYQIKVNDVQLSEISANTMNWAFPESHSISIPPGVVKQDGRVGITISWVTVADNDLGFALTSLEYK